jgi:hypothetical protein
MTVRYFTAFCSNPACHHARRPHPIRGSLYMSGSSVVPGSATSECPACDSELTNEPLFKTDEPYHQEEAA